MRDEKYAQLNPSKGRSHMFISSLSNGAQTHCAVNYMMKAQAI